MTLPRRLLYQKPPDLQEIQGSSLWPSRLDPPTHIPSIAMVEVETRIKLWEGESRKAVDARRAEDTEPPPTLVEVETCIKLLEEDQQGRSR